MTQYSNLGGEWHRHVERLTPRGRTGDKCPWVDGWGRMAVSAIGRGVESAEVATSAVYSLRGCVVRDDV